MAFGDTDIVSEAGAREATLCAAGACIAFPSLILMGLLAVLRFAGPAVLFGLPTAMLILLVAIVATSFACAFRFARQKGEHVGFLMLLALLASVLATAFVALSIDAAGIFAVIPVATLATVVGKLVLQGMRGARNLREPSPEFFE
ncbi:hypothetical protein [Novosphingobium sp. KA1]|uniref:hypothetical protein n=1 Tax=Novosphingobium sp. (strain KA1) TaxID=164608 RepID=UPI001A8D0823|nr:hypothetical protein [Novosphingobium sp. KA1]QSR18658.1 hypothetical protein CA833_15930 [Novosphingobium sp. KA1]